MLLVESCEKFIHVHETEDEIRHKAIQTALLSFFLFSANISPFILGTVCIFFRSGV
jgi:hypothetical protein